jgi:hypothetical protein
MISRLLLILSAFALLTMNAFAISKTIAYKPFYESKIVGEVQYVRKGKPLIDLGRAPYVAIVDPKDSSITVTYPQFGNPDSLFIHFIPGNLINIRLSTDVEWVDSLGIYQYRYILYSDKSSARPIWEFEVEWLNDYQSIKCPYGWMQGTTYRSHRKVYTWSAFQENDYLIPGDSLSGIGFSSYGPPTIASFSVWGFRYMIADSSIHYDRATNEAIGAAYSDIESQTRALEGYTIVPGVQPEGIEPVEWFSRIDARSSKLSGSGYLDQETWTQVHQVFLPVIALFKKPVSYNLDYLEQEINNTLSALEPYRNQMEPEAWAFVTENLKYILRHKDIVRFKEYP